MSGSAYGRASSSGRDSDDRVEDEHAAQLWRELVESSVECELCNEPYDESDAHLPRLLSCGHTFCQSCLEDWSATAISTGLDAVPTDPITGLALGSMECPTCRRVTTFNAVEGPRALPKNFELLRVRQEMESQTQQRLQQLKQVWTTQVLEKEKLARVAEQNAMVAQRESVQAAQRAMFLAKQVAINEQEKKQAQEIAEEARRRALLMSQQAEALQAETEQLKLQLQQEAMQLQRVRRDASSKAAEAAELSSKAEQLKHQVECVRAQLSLHSGRHDPSKLVVLVVEPTTVGSWLMPYTRYAVISIARSDGSSSSNPSLDPYLAAKTWIKMRHVLVADSSSSVKVYRRYSDFVWLHHELYKRFPYELVPSIPAKQLFFFNKDKEFVGERMRSLQAFLREILRHPVLATTEFVRAFLLSTTEELENLRNASRLNDDEDDSFLKEVEASEAASATTRGSLTAMPSTPTSSIGGQDTGEADGSVVDPPATTSTPSKSRGSWAWGAVSAFTNSAAKLVTSTGNALTSSISNVSSTVASSSSSSAATDDAAEKSLSTSLTMTDDEQDRLPPATRKAIEKRRQFVEIARAHQSVALKGAHLSRVQRKYSHHLHRLCELMHAMDTLDSEYAEHKRARHLLAVSTMDQSSTTYTARQVEEDARACLESEQPFQEKASDVFSALSLATSNDAECMEYALLEISRMQTSHLGAIEDAFARLRPKEKALQRRVRKLKFQESDRSSFTSLPSTPMSSSSGGAYGNGYESPTPRLSTRASFSSPASTSVLLSLKQEELQSRRNELIDKVHQVDPQRAKFVLETLQHNAKEMHTLAVAKRKLHEASYSQLLAACGGQ